MAQDVERKRPEEWRDLVDGARFIDRFMPSPIRGGLTSDTWGTDEVRPRDTSLGIEDPDWSYWGGNIRREGDLYHLFVCRWAESHPKGHAAWPQSSVVRATSTSPWGPFKVAEEIGRGHNPEIFETKDGGYVLYVIDGCYRAPSLQGPWEKGTIEFRPRGRRVIEGFSNFSFARRPDGSVLAVCRGGGIWVSEDGEAPFEQVTNRRAYPAVAGRFEDPVIWRTSVQYHMIVNDWLGRIAWYLRSKDGFDWQVQPGEAYAPGIDRYEDGTDVGWYKYERMKVLQDEHGRAFQAAFAVIDCPKKEDRPNDTHSSKWIPIPLRVGRLLEITDREPIGPKTREIRVRVRAEEGFDPQNDLDPESLRFGAAGEVDFGHGCRVIRKEKDGEDLVLVFDAKGHGLASGDFAAKLLGKDRNGGVVFGYVRLPGVDYNDFRLSSDMPVATLSDGRMNFRLPVKNYGLGASPAQRLTVRLKSKDTEFGFGVEAPPLQPFEEQVIGIAVPSDLGAGSYHLTVSSDTQESALFESERKLLEVTSSP